MIISWIISYWFDHLFQFVTYVKNCILKRGIFFFQLAFFNWTLISTLKCNFFNVRILGINSSSNLILKTLYNVGLKGHLKKKFPFLFMLWAIVFMMKFDSTPSANLHMFICVFIICMLYSRFSFFSFIFTSKIPINFSKVTLNLRKKLI